MTKQLLDHAQVGAAIEQVGGETVAQHVRVHLAAGHGGVFVYYLLGAAGHYARTVAGKEYRRGFTVFPQKSRPFQGIEASERYSASHLQVMREARSGRGARRD